MDAWFPDQIEVSVETFPRCCFGTSGADFPLSLPQTMKTVGNAKARAIWEGNLPSGFQVPDENASRAVMDVWIADKYQHKKYFKPVRPCDAVPIPVPRQFSQKVRTSPQRQFWQSNSPHGALPWNRARACRWPARPAATALARALPPPLRPSRRSAPRLAPGPRPPGRARSMWRRRSGP